jgi:SAM-dependent methyltransferase
VEPQEKRSPPEGAQPAHLLSGLERRLSFDGVAEIYDRVRHSYPSQAFSNLFDFWGDGNEARSPIGDSRERQVTGTADERVARPAGDELEVLEIGPGTGKATRSLLDAGARVTAVEYGPRMAAYLRKHLGGEPRLTVLEGSFEGVVLPLMGFDIVVAATAFHWIDPSVRLDKSIGVLRPSGVLATLSTVQVRSDVDRGFFDRTSPIYRRYRDTEVGDDIGPLPEDVSPKELEEFRAHPGLRDATLRLFRWDQTYTSSSYADLLRSYSNMQIMPPAARESLISDLCALIDSDFGGSIVRPLVIALAMARKVAPA